MNSTKTTFKNTAIMACVAVACLCVGSAVADDRCINSALPTKFIRVWDLELGEGVLSNVGGLPCDKQDWVRIPRNDKPSRTGVTNSVGMLLIDQVMDDLEAMGDNDNASAYYCPDGIKWYYVDKLGGCNLKDDSVFTLRGKTYQNDDENMTMVQSIKAVVSYVCNNQARTRILGVAYTAVVRSECRDDGL